MKPIFKIALAAMSLFYCCTMTIGAPIGKIEINVDSVSPAGEIILTLKNASQSTIRLWEEYNSWGAARWRVLLYRGGHLDVFFQNPNQGFTKNNPSFTEIEGGAHVQQKLNLNAGDWCLQDQCAAYDERGIGGKKIKFQANDKIFIIYDVPRTVEAIKLNVWYGVVATEGGLPR